MEDIKHKIIRFLEVEIYKCECDERLTEDKEILERLNIIKYTFLDVKSKINKLLKE